MRVCLDAGHTYGLNRLGKDPGAINVELGLKESVIAMEIVSTLGSMLAEKNIGVEYTRTNGTFDLTLMKRCFIANKANVDLFASIHLNSSDNKTANGIETLRYPTRNKRTIEFADKVQKKLIEATGARDRGVKERNDLCVLRHTEMPAVLIEVGFISNREEALKLNDPEYQRVICKAIADAIDSMR